MEIKLSWKTYPFKINNAACKSFYDLTGMDLQSVLIDHLEVVGNSSAKSLMARMSELQKVCGRFIAAKAIHCLVKQENKNIPLAEIEDATFRVGWLPTDDESGMVEPWCIVMVDIATQVNQYYTENIPTKKSVMLDNQNEN
tara:strand:- start:289 stop:711 length:423 start_codon:yes stop_codon:yes gene_type:complete